MTKTDSDTADGAPDRLRATRQPAVASQDARVGEMLEAAAQNVNVRLQTMLDPAPLDTNARVRQMLRPAALSINARARETFEPAKLNIDGRLDEIRAPVAVNINAHLRKRIVQHLPEVARLTAGVAARLSIAATMHAAETSAAVLGELSTGDHPSQWLEQLAENIAGSHSFAQLWGNVEAHIDSAHDGRPPGLGWLGPAQLDRREAARWQITSFLITLRLSANSSGTVEGFAKVVSTATTAFIACAVIRTGYPQLWRELEKLRLTPFEIVVILLDLLGYFNCGGSEKSPALTTRADSNGDS